MSSRALIAICLLLAGTALGAAEPPPLPDNPLSGRLLLESRNCVLCHGVSGQTPGIGPDLGQGAFRGTFLDLGAALWNHVPGMSVSFEDARLPWPELTEPEAVELTAFIYFIEYLGRPGNANAGGRVFSSKGCDRCHSLGEGGSGDLAELRHFASPLFIAQAIWNHGPSMFETMRSAGMAPPTFAAGDLADLSAYLRRAIEAGPQERMLLTPGSPNRGRRLFSSRGCALCHGKDGSGRGSGPDLTGVDLHRSAEAIAGTMWNHAEVMSDTMRARGLRWPRFSTGELADLVAFLYFLPFADPAGDAERGARVFSSRSCVECHAETASSGHAGPDLAESEAAGSPAALVAAMWNHAPVMKEAILGEGRPWPELTGEDLRDLLAYFEASAAAAEAGR